MGLLHPNNVKDIQSTEVTRTISIKDESVRFVFRNMATGVYKGKRIILDETLINNMVSQIAEAIGSNRSKYNEIPSEIIFSNDELSNRNNEVRGDVVEAGKSGNIVDCYESRFGFDDIVLSPDIFKQIKVAISAYKNKSKLVNEWGMGDKFGLDRAIILNFYGKAGTGKSMTAEAIAKELGKKVYRVNYADLESKYVGDTPKNIRQVFNMATNEDAVLIFDEADSFLGKRLSSVTQSADYGVNITRSVLLMELERFKGIVIFTTNLLENYDEAFKRRIFLNVFFELPDERAREQIWKIHLGDKVPVSDQLTFEWLASRYQDISGADIKDIVFYAALSAVENGQNELLDVNFDEAYNAIRERYHNRKGEDNIKIIATEHITEEQYLKETSLAEEKNND